MKHVIQTRVPVMPLQRLVLFELCSHCSQPWPILQLALVPAPAHDWIHLFAFVLVISRTEHAHFRFVTLQPCCPQDLHRLLISQHRKRWHDVQFCCRQRRMQQQQRDCVHMRVHQFIVCCTLSHRLCSSLCNISRMCLKCAIRFVSSSSTSLNFGGITLGAVYYVHAILSATTFSISNARGGTQRSLTPGMQSSPSKRFNCF